MQVRRKDEMVHCGSADAIIEREDAGAGAAKEGMAARAIRGMVEGRMAGKTEFWTENFESKSSSLLRLQ